MDATVEPVEMHVTTHAKCSGCEKNVCLDFDCMCSEPGTVVDGKVWCRECVGGAL